MFLGFCRDLHTFMKRAVCSSAWHLYSPDLGLLYVLSLDQELLGSHLQRSQERLTSPNLTSFFHERSKRRCVLLNTMTQPTTPPCGGELLRARGYLQPPPASNDRCFCKLLVKCGKDAPFNFPFFWELKTKTNKETIKTKAHHIFWRMLVKFWTTQQVLKRQTIQQLTKYISGQE